MSDHIHKSHNVSALLYNVSALLYNVSALLYHAVCPTK